MEAIFFFSAKQTHVSHLTDAPVIAVKAFERGFYPVHTTLTPEQLNHGHWSAEQLEAALLGWMFGWDAPGARPAVKAVVVLERQRVRAAV
jgi:hypothetical protein